MLRGNPARVEAPVSRRSRTYVCVYLYSIPRRLATVALPSVVTWQLSDSGCVPRLQDMHWCFRCLTLSFRHFVAGNNANNYSSVQHDNRSGGKEIRGMQYTGNYKVVLLYIYTHNLPEWFNTVIPEPLLQNASVTAFYGLYCFRREWSRYRQNYIDTLYFHFCTFKNHIDSRWIELYTFLLLYIPPVLSFSSERINKSGVLTDSTKQYAIVKKYILKWIEE